MPTGNVPHGRASLRAVLPAEPESRGSFVLRELRIPLFMSSDFDPFNGSDFDGFAAAFNTHGAVT